MLPPWYTWEHFTEAGLLEEINWVWMLQKFAWHHCNASSIVPWVLPPMRKCTKFFSFIFSFFGLYFMIANTALKDNNLPLVVITTRRCSNTQLLKSPLLAKEKKCIWLKEGMNICRLYFYTYHEETHTHFLSVSFS